MSDFSLGLVAALASSFFFGTFAVPIKTPSVVAAKVDPVVFQLYKTTACFATCWLALAWVDFRFTWWGVVGASIWVVNGTLAIVAVQKAGLGIAQSIWSGLSIYVSFFWGVAVFGEPVRSMSACVLALLLMTVGMAGLALAAAGRFKESERKPDSSTPYLQASLLAHEDGEGKGKDGRYCRAASRDFNVGMAAAVYVGLANGSFMMPLKYANQEVKGAEYLVSFGIGAMVVTLVLGAAYAAVRRATGRPLPSLQVEVAARPALLTGVLWSAGNVCSIFATEYLGMALGWPLVQCQLIISNLWGIFYYGEITGQRSITAFLSSAGLLLAGVVVLSAFGK